MKKRIISLVLAVVLLFSLFSLPASAAWGSLWREFLSEEEAKQFEIGEYFEFDRFIDIEKYVRNAGQPEYDEISIIGIDTPQIKEIDAEGNPDQTVYRWLLPVYIYNPNRRYVSKSSLGSMKCNNGISDEMTWHFVGTYLYEDDAFTDEEYVDHMFIKGYIVGTYDESEYFDSFSYYDLVFNFGQMSFCTYSFDFMQGYVEEWTYFTIDDSIRVSNFDNAIYKSNVESDLAHLEGMDVLEIKALYENNAVDLKESINLIYMYEVKTFPGFADLFVYLYCPEYKELSDDLILRMISGNKGSVWTNVNFKKVSSTDYGLHKFKTTVSAISPPGGKFSPTSDYRNYYINKATAYSVHRNPNRPGNKTLIERSVSLKTHYEFSENEIASDRQRIVFTYPFKFDLLGQTYYGLDKNEAFKSFYLDIPDGLAVYEYDKSVLSYDEASGAFTLLKPDVEYVHIIFSTTFPVYTEWPVANSTVSSSSQTLWLDESYYGWNIFDPGAISFFTIPDESAEEDDAEETGSVESKYVRVKYEEKLELEVTPTYYQPSISNIGNGFRNVLTSVGFGVPEDIVSLNDEDPSNDRWIEYIDYQTYKYDIPIIFTTWDEIRSIPFVKDNTENDLLVVDYSDYFTKTTVGGYTYYSLNINSSNLGFLAGDTSLEFSDDYDSIEWPTFMIGTPLGGGLIFTDDPAVLGEPSDEDDWVNDFATWVLDFLFDYSDSECGFVSPDFCLIYVVDKIPEPGEIIATSDEMKLLFEENKEAIRNLISSQINVPDELKSDYPPLTTTVNDVVCKIWNNTPSYYLGLFEKERVTFADSFDLISYKDSTLWTKIHDFGFFDGLWKHWWGMNEDYPDTEENISVFELIYPSELDDILSMSDSDFSFEYKVAPTEVSKMRAEVISELAKGNVYVFFRFDHYYSAEFEGDYHFSNNGKLDSASDHNAATQLSVQRFYDEFEMIEIGFSNSEDTVVYGVIMEKLTFTKDATAADPVTDDDFDTPGNRWKNLFDDLFDNIFTWIIIILAGILLIILIFVVVKALLGRSKVVIKNGEDDNNKKKRRKKRSKKKAAPSEKRSRKKRKYSRGRIEHKNVRVWKKRK